VELLDTIAVDATSIALLGFAVCSPRPPRRSLPLVHLGSGGARVEGNACVRPVDISADAWTRLLENSATHLVNQRTTRSDPRQVESCVAGHAVS
jgi:hypothetical protein